MCGKHSFWASFELTVTTAIFFFLKKHLLNGRNTQWDDEIMKTSQAPTCLPSRTRTPPDSANMVADRSKPRPRIIHPLPSGRCFRLKVCFRTVCTPSHLAAPTGPSTVNTHSLQMCNATYALSCAESDHHNRPQHHILVKICPPHPAGKVRHM